MDIASPPVLIGDFKEDVGSNTLDEAAQRILSQQTGSPFDTEGTPIQVEAALKTHYFDLGYLEADIQPGRDSPRSKPRPRFACRSR